LIVIESGVVCVALYSVDILNADAKGNFYSVGPVDFTGGLYPAVVGATATKYMGSSITTGACNSCHAGGTSTARVWTN